MKEQYVGDVNDYRKYALLRHLTQVGGVRVGVCWMLTPPDDRPDGGKTAYLDHPEQWRAFDPDLYERLKSVSKGEGTRRLRLIERTGVIPNALFFNEHLSDRVDLRRAFFEAALSELRRADLIFFDPDNGLERAKRKGRKDSSKYIYCDEVQETYRQGHSILIYQHFPMEKKQDFIQRLGARLSVLAPDARLWCFRTPFAAFFLLAHPSHTARLTAAADGTPEHWRPRFIQSERLSPDIAE